MLSSSEERVSFGFEESGFSLDLKFWLFGFWFFVGFWFGAGFGFFWGFLGPGLRKSTSLKPEEDDGGREVARPREEAKDAMSDLRC